MTLGASPIIDAHHHVWTLNRTPWLAGPPVPRVFGDYGALRRDYLIDEYATDVEAAGVVKSVYVQVNVAPGDEIWEVEWTAAEGERKGLMQAIVGYADLRSPSLADTLEAQSATQALRGIRQQLHWHTDPLYCFADRPDLMGDIAWQAGLRELTRRGLHFELQVFTGQYDDTLAMIDRHAAQRFVLLHAGMPEDRSADGRARWTSGLKQFAERPNVVVKLSALSTFARRLIVEEWTDIVRMTVDIFGPERAMFGSNFPIEKLWTDYSSLVAAMEAGLAIYTPEERRAVWHDTAAGWYGLENEGE